MATKARLHWFWHPLFLVPALLVGQAILSMGLLRVLTDPLMFPLLKLVPFLHVVAGVLLLAGGSAAWLIKERHVRPTAAGVICAGLLSIAAFWPVRNLERHLTRNAQRWSCAIHLGHLWPTMHDYSNRHRGQCPPTLEAFLDQYPDLREWRCAGRKSADFLSSYGYIPARRYDDYDKADIIFYEKPGGHPWDGGNALFGDGRFEWIEPYSRLLELVRQTERRLADQGAAASQPNGNYVVDEQQAIAIAKQAVEAENPRAKDTRLDGATYDVTKTDDGWTVWVWCEPKKPGGFWIVMIGHNGEVSDCGPGK